jgi:hypothetical protein
LITLAPPDHPFSVDLAHTALLVGIVLSVKPQRVVELGIGPGYCARALLQALNWNRCGELVCVDNWTDTAGREPPEAEQLRGAGASVIVSSEEDYCRACPGNFCDVLISDADHNRADQWVAEHLRMVRPGGWLFYHDTANPEFPNLGRIPEAVAHLPNWHFTEASRPDENCARGWLVVQNCKPRLAVVSAWDGALSELAAVVLPNRQRYCDRWGYELVTRDHWPRAAQLAPVWNKWQLALEALPRFDAVFCVDLDCLVMAPERPLESFLTAADFLASCDCNGLNTGAVFLRNSRWTLQFLERSLTTAPRYSGHPSTEQSTLAHLLYAEPRERWACAPQRAFNAYRYDLYPHLPAFPEGEYQRGDFLLHLPSLPVARKVELFRGLV